MTDSRPHTRHDETEWPLVYCIILNWNGAALLPAALDTVLTMTYPNFKVLVVDNASTDGSVSLVREKYPDVILIENDENLGFGEGNNVGMRHALQAGADWVFLLNFDIEVDSQLLSELMAVAIADNRIGMLGPKIYFFNQPEVFWYAGGVVRFFTGEIAHRGLRETDHGQYDAIEDSDYITGCALLVRSEVLRDIGLFDPIYNPAYTEDADLSQRARLADYRLVYVPGGRLWHKVSSASGGGLTPFKTKLKIQHNLIFFRRYARWYHWLTIPWAIGGELVVFVLQQLFSGNFKIIGALVQGFGQALRSLLKR